MSKILTSREEFIISRKKITKVLQKSIKKIIKVNNWQIVNKKTWTELARGMKG